MKRSLAALLFLIAMGGCGPSQLFPSLPADLNRETAHKETIEMTAEHFHFTPDVLHVKQGTLVTLKVKAIDGTHGFSLGAFGIDEKIEENETKVIEFYAGQKGEYGFKCSHFCGLGHLGMNGKVIVE